MRRDHRPWREITSAFSANLPEIPEDLPAVITELMGVLAGERPVILIGYGPQLQVSTVIAAACGALTSSSAEVLNAVRVEDSRYWSYLEEDPAIGSEGIALNPGLGHADPDRATTDADGTTATPVGHADAPAHNEAASEAHPADR